MNRSERVVDYDRMFDPPEIHEEDVCFECHKEHRLLAIYQKGCDWCLDERCLVCHGRKVIGAGKLEEECSTCKGTGRIE